MVLTSSYSPFPTSVSLTAGLPDPPGGVVTAAGSYYSISVAAVNENGDVGQSSAAVRTRTDQCNRFIPIINMLWLMFVLCCSLWF